MEMEEDVWSNYPEELRLAILKRLPWMDKLRLRQVCVLWNTILRDPSLLTFSRSPSGSLPFCCACFPHHGGKIQLYSPLGKSWHTFSFSTNFKVIAAAAGLFLLQGGSDVKRILILLNPLNRTQRQLPLPPELEDIALHPSCIFEMSMEKETDTLRILAGEWHVSSDDNVRNMHLRNWHNWKFHVYSMNSNSWKLVADLSVRDEGYPRHTFKEQLPSATLVGRDLYLLSTFHGTSTHLYKISLSPRMQPSPTRSKLGPEQDLVVGGESGAQLPPSSSYVDSKIFECEGRLMLVVRQKFRIGKVDDLQNNFWELCMYEFDFATSEWRTSMDLPPALVRSRSYVTFAVDGGYVFFHNDVFTGICNIRTKTWRLLPHPVCQSKNRYSPVTKIFLFQPRLDIIL